MATSPGFAATPKVGVVDVSAANTNRDGTGTLAGGSPTWFAAGASGSLVETLIIQSTGQPADSVLHIYLFDGTTAHLAVAVDMGAPAAGSTTVTSYSTQVDLTTISPGGFKLPAGWSLRASVTVAPTSGVIKVIAMGGDF